MTIEDIMTKIRQEILSKFEVEFIMANQSIDKPIYPYITYSIIGLKSVSKYSKVENAENENVVNKINVLQFEATISITTISKDEFEAIELAKNLHNWFGFSGYNCLQSGQRKVVVIDVTELSSREFLIIDEYEKRWGFDIVIRFADADEYESQYIDKVNILRRN